MPDTQDTSHPLRKFWVEESEWWHPGDSVRPEDCFGEGQLAIDVWNAAIKQAAEAVRFYYQTEQAAESVECLIYQQQQPHRTEGLADHVQRH